MSAWSDGPVEEQVNRVKCYRGGTPASSSSNQFKTT